MRVIIAGSRGITAAWCVVKACTDSGFYFDEVVSGTARGVDLLGEQWAEYRNIPVKRFKPDWNAHGKKAGFLRNKNMGDYADALVAVWDGESKGTKQMIDYMKGLGKPVYVLNVKDDT